MIRIVQCLCPQRHAILAIAYEPGITAAQEDFGGTDDITLTEENAADYLRSMVEGLVKRQSLNPWCGVCHSRQFTYEDRPTRFATMREAIPELQRLEDAQQRTRVFFDAGRN